MDTDMCPFVPFWFPPIRISLLEFLPFQLASRATSSRRHSDYSRNVGIASGIW